MKTPDFALAPIGAEFFDIGGGFISWVKEIDWSTARGYCWDDRNKVWIEGFASERLLKIPPREIELNWLADTFENWPNDCFIDGFIPSSQYYGDEPIDGVVYCRYGITKAQWQERRHQRIEAKIISSYKPINKKPVAGVGINDANYPVQGSKGGKNVSCPFYARWVKMIQRCYLESRLIEDTLYRDVEVCEDWHSFMNFREWMQAQDWEDKYLDKDILSNGSKIYSPETCVFVHKKVNGFVVDRSSHSGDYPLGVCFDKEMKKLVSSITNPLTGKREHIGYFEIEDADKAHSAWIARKHEICCELADSEYVTDKRVADALRTRYVQ